MLTREITLPVDVEQMWEALTDPSPWIGSRVDWELVPGGRASFVGGPDGDREGQVDEVEPGRRLAFRWWPEGEPDDESEVTCDVEPTGDGTRLVVTERRLAPREKTTSGPQASALPDSADWSCWDDRMAGFWVAGAAMALVTA